MKSRFFYSQGNNIDNTLRLKALSDCEVLFWKEIPNKHFNSFISYQQKGNKTPSLSLTHRERNYSVRCQTWVIPTSTQCWDTFGATIMIFFEHSGLQHSTTANNRLMLITNNHFLSGKSLYALYLLMSICNFFPVLFATLLKRHLHTVTHLQCQTWILLFFFYSVGF